MSHLDFCLVIAGQSYGVHLCNLELILSNNNHSCGMVYGTVRYTVWYVSNCWCGKHPSRGWGVVAQVRVWVRVRS